MQALPKVEEKIKKLEEEASSIDSAGEVRPLLMLTISSNSSFGSSLYVQGSLNLLSLVTVLLSWLRLRIPFYSSVCCSLPDCHWFIM